MRKHISFSIEELLRQNLDESRGLPLSLLPGTTVTAFLTLATPLFRSWSTSDILSRLPIDLATAH